MRFFKRSGIEFKEDIQSGIQAAAAGGFTQVACLPNTQPIIQSKDTVSYIAGKTKGALVTIRPIGAVTMDTKGGDLTEMLDMHEAGAIAFSNGEEPIMNSDVILRALIYLHKINGLLIQKPEDKNLNLYGVINEGITSTRLGLKGMPKLAEEIMVMRDLKLLEYAEGRLHFSNISTAKSVELIREAKKKGLSVTCDIAAHQVAFDDSVLEDFDTFFKVNPPFRHPADIEALWGGLADGTIDSIVSSHKPQDEESKKLEFDLAEFGIIGLETVFAIINTYNKGLKLEHIIDKLSYNPRKILGLPIQGIKEGEGAEITLFDPFIKWTYLEKESKSKSRNSPFFGRELKGRPLGIINKENSFFI